MRNNSNKSNKSQNPDFNKDVKTKIELINQLLETL